MSETKEVYVAYANTDLTAGTGYNVPIAICEMEITAIRLARYRNVQGSEGIVNKVSLVKLNGIWYYPGSAVTVVLPSGTDIEAQKLLDARRAIIHKMESLGMTEQEIRLLSS